MADDKEDQSVQRDLMQKQEMSRLKDEVTTKALHIIRNIFPAKVLALSKKLDEKPFNLDLAAVRQPIVLVGDSSMAVDSSEEPRSKKRKIDELTAVPANNGAAGNSVVKSSEVIESNKIIGECIALCRGILLEFIEQLNSVKMWIQLNIPRIEDGNNFGVSIQEETLNELTRAEDTAFANLDNIAKYFVTRAKLVSKCLKYPGVQDYRHSVQELDEKEFIDLKNGCRELRNLYAILFDIISKNWEKIRKPRTEHTSQFY